MTDPITAYQDWRHRDLQPILLHHTPMTLEWVYHGGHHHGRQAHAWMSGWQVRPIVVRVWHNVGEILWRELLQPLRVEVL